MSHYYDCGEYKYPSVTTIIGECTNKADALVQWSANQTVEWIRQNCTKENGYFVVSDDALNSARFEYKNVSQQALDIGTAVHHAIEMFIQTGREPKLSHEQAEAGFLAFLEWFDGNDCKTVSAEQSVFGNCWAGTLDWKGYINGKLYVTDWKTSAAIYNDYRYQIAAYRSTDPEVEGCGVLRLDKKTGYPEWKDFSKTYTEDLFVFNKMVELYFARHKRIAKKAGWGNEK